MTKSEFRDLLRSTYARLLLLSDTKGEEYSNGTDQLANFKRIGDQLGIDPAIVVMIAAEKHLDAIRYCVRHGGTLSEHIGGRLDDAILYLHLLHAVLDERDSTACQPTSGNCKI